MNRRVILASLILSLAIGVGGCVQRTLNVSSDPPGALVYLNDQEVGRTPFSRDFKWYGVYDVQVRMEGYQTLDTKKDLIAPPWLWFPVDLLAELAPWGVKDIRDWNFALQPASTQPGDQTVMLARSQELRDKLESSRYTHFPATRPTTEPTP